MWCGSPLHLPLSRSLFRLHVQMRRFVNFWPGEVGRVLFALSWCECCGWPAGSHAGVTQSFKLVLAHCVPAGGGVEADPAVAQRTKARMIGRLGLC